MSYIVVGLGNPGEEYEHTRHSAGRLLVQMLGKAFDAEWKEDKKLKAQVAKTKIGSSAVTLLLPDTFMNNSGDAVKPLVGSAKAAEKVVVIYDDLDLPFGKSKISFNRSSGGHKGVESIIKALKTEKFARIRVGISPTTPTGKIKKPLGEEAVSKVIMGKWKPEETAELKKLVKKIQTTLEIFVGEGLEKAMTGFN